MIFEKANRIQKESWIIAGHQLLLILLILRRGILCTVRSSRNTLICHVAKKNSIMFVIGSFRYRVARLLGDNLRAKSSCSPCLALRSVHGRGGGSLWNESHGSLVQLPKCFTGKGLRVSFVANSLSSN